MVPNTCNKVANALTKLALLNDFGRRQSHMIVIMINVLIFYLMHLIGWENLTKKEVAITKKPILRIQILTQYSTINKTTSSLL